MTNATEQAEVKLDDSETQKSDEAQVKEPAETKVTSKASPTMKLVVRSPYWGRVLKGKFRRNFENPSHPFRVITCQAVLAVEGQYWGCCPHHGKRVLEMQEHHFIDQYPHDWDLYMVGSSVSTSYVVHAFFLLPQNQTAIDINRKIKMEGWHFIATVSASMMRLELERYLYDLLKQNDLIGFRLHHVHLEILMEQVFDRETPKSRKDACEKRRNDKNSVLKSVAGDSKMPPIPHVVSNDASWNTDTTHSSSMTSTVGPEGWNDMTNPAFAAYYHPEAFSRWYPGAGSQTVPPILPPMNPIQQLLVRGYPPSYMPPPPTAMLHGPHVDYVLPYEYQGSTAYQNWTMMPQPEYYESEQGAPDPGSAPNGQR